MIAGPAAFVSRYRGISAKREKKEGPLIPVNNDLSRPLGILTEIANLRIEFYKKLKNVSCEYDRLNG